MTSCAQAQDRGAGEMVFRDQGCFGCHTSGRWVRRSHPISRTSEPSGTRLI
jgi:mono/diheme cytochrome c family protein